MPAPPSDCVYDWPELGGTSAGLGARPLGWGLAPLLCPLSLLSLP